MRKVMPASPSIWVRAAPKSVPRWMCGSGIFSRRSSWGISVHMALLAQPWVCATAAGSSPAKTTDRRRGSIRIRRRVEPAPASGPHRYGSAERTSSKLRGLSRCLAGFFSSCASPLAFFSAWSLLCLRLFRPGQQLDAGRTGYDRQLQLFTEAEVYSHPQQQKQDKQQQNAADDPQCHQADPPFRRLYGSFTHLHHPARAVLRQTQLAVGLHPASPADPPASSGGTPGGMLWWCGTAVAFPAPAAARTPR